jgi:butyryl-CoA dehydrogenase
MENLKNKIAVITGAGSGIGRALAIHLAKEGCQLALNDFNEEGLNETLKLLPPCEVYSEVFDVSDKDHFSLFSENVMERFGSVALVINNAGVTLGKQSTLQTSFADFEWIMNINLWGVIYGTKLFLPHLLKTKESCLVNISSVFGLMGIADQTPYCTTKFAVRGFTESLRMEMINKDILITSVHPGGVKTNIARNAKGWDHVKNKDEVIKRMEKESFIHTPEKAAKVIVDGIKKGKERILIGRDAYTIDALTRFFPVGYTKIVSKQLQKKMRPKT